MDSKIKVADRIIIGIDPGTNLMGYGILGIKGKKPSLIAMGVIDLHKLGDHYTRLGRIYERVSMLVDQYCPDEMAIEAPFFGKTCNRCSSLAAPKEWPWQQPCRAKCLSRSTSHAKSNRR